MLIPRNVLSSLIVATDTSTSRYALGGLRFERSGDKCAAVATDGRRLISAEWTDGAAVASRPELGGLQTGPAPGSDFAEKGTIITAVDCAAMAKAAKPKATALKKVPTLAYVALEECSASGKVKMAASDGATVAAREVASVEGRFPRWRDVVPVDRPRVSHLTFCTPEELERETAGGGQYGQAARKLAEETNHGGNAPHGAVVKVHLDARYLAELAAAINNAACSEESAGLDLIVPLDPTAPTVLEKVTDAITVRAVIIPISG